MQEEGGAISPQVRYGKTMQAVESKAIEGSCIEAEFQSRRGKINTMKFAKENTPPLSMEDLIKLEQKIGCTLPQDYRNFLIHHNGGEPEYQVLTIPDCHDETLVDRFLGIGRTHDDIQEWRDELSDDLGDAFLAIGLDSGGNALLMDLLDRTIYYWDSARYLNCSSDDENAFWIADSFSDLLERLKLYRP